MKIDDERAAIRLARAVISDVLLYGGKVEDWNEARALFMNKVAERLHPLFDQVLGDPSWSPGREEPPAARETAQPPRRRESALPGARIDQVDFERPHHARGGGGSHWPIVFFAAGFASLIIAALLLFLASRPS